MNKDQNRFKMILTIVFGLSILIGLMAFSTYKSSNSKNIQTPITIWGTLDKDIFANYLSQYSQDKSVDLKVTYTQKDINTIDNELIEAMATGKAPDVILIPQEFEKRYLDKVDMITSISERTFKDTFVQEADLYIQPNGIFGLPFFIDPLVMYWNKDTLISAGIATPPSKWEEFPLLAQKLSQSDNNANITKSAVSFGEFSNVDNAKAILSTLILQAGSPIVKYDNGAFLSFLNKKTNTSDLMVPAVSALRFFTDYSNPKNTIYSWNSSLPSSKLSFLSGDLATYFGFASEYQDIKDKNPNLNFDVAIMPQASNATVKVTFGELYGFAILKTSPNATAAINTLLTMISSDSVFEFLQVYGVAPARNDLITAGSPDPVKTVFYNSALISNAWMDPNSNKTDQIFKDMVENITTGSMSTEDSVSKASDELDNLLQ